MRAEWASPSFEACRCALCPFRERHNTDGSLAVAVRQRSKRASDCPAVVQHGAKVSVPWGDETRNQLMSRAPGGSRPRLHLIGNFCPGVAFCQVATLERHTVQVTSRRAFCCFSSVSCSRRRLVCPKFWREAGSLKIRIATHSALTRTCGLATVSKLLQQHRHHSMQTVDCQYATQITALPQNFGQVDTPPQHSPI